MKLLAPALSMAAVLLAGCMSLPDGVHVHRTDTGCTSTNVCPFGKHSANYYYAPLREVVVHTQAGSIVVLHELCHAHQHAVILEELGQEPTLDLREWYDTSEGQDWEGRFPVGTVWTWGPTPLEDFANSCALYNLDKASLQQLDLERYNWVRRELQ